MVIRTQTNRAYVMSILPKAQLRVINMKKKSRILKYIVDDRFGACEKKRWQAQKTTVIVVMGLLMTLLGIGRIIYFRLSSSMSVPRIHSRCIIGVTMVGSRSMT